MGSKYELDIVKGLLQFMCVGSLAGVTYLRFASLHSADEPQEGRNTCPLLRSCFIGSCHVGVSKRVSRSISPAVYTVFSLQLFQFTLSDQSFKLTRQDRMVVWVEVEGCCTCRILMRCNVFEGFFFLSFFLFSTRESKLFKPQ